MSTLQAHVSIKCVSRNNITMASNINLKQYYAVLKCGEW